MSLRDPQRLKSNRDLLNPPDINVPKLGAGDFNIVTQDAENWANIKDQYLLQPIFGGEGRVLILQDPTKSRYDCKVCGGKGHTNEVCKYCLGTKYKNGYEKNGECPDCTVRSVGWSGREGNVTYGKEPCKECGGKGGTIIIPDDSKTKTTMGNVIAVSDNGIKCVKIRNKVQYTNYTGIAYEFMGLSLVVAHEKDLLCIVKQLKTSVDAITERPDAEEDHLMGTRHKD